MELSRPINTHCTMKNLFLAILTTVFVVSCNSVKKTAATLNSGNYDDAIAITLKKLQRNPDKKNKQDFVLLLEDAFAKASARDTDRIAFLVKENQQTNLEEIYETYVALQRRQDRIRPILPLQVIDENRTARFDFVNYDNKLISSKEKLVESLYSSSLEAIATATLKEDYRNIYDDLAYLNNLKPGYKDIKNMMESVHLKGTDFVAVTLFNDSNIALPIRLENELLDFSTYGLNDFWTVYHSNTLTSAKYDYNMEVAFTEINISPERIKEREVQREKLIKDGTIVLKDEEGNVVYDEDGEKVLVDNMITVRCTYFEFIQNKAVNVVGRVRYSDGNTNQVLQSLPLASEFIFDHRYATYRGDRRALEEELYERTRNRAIPFPTNEQMVYDAGEDIKNRIKDIILRNNN